MTDQTPADDAYVRATQLEELLAAAEQAGNTAETVRVELVADNKRLRATLAAARAAVAEVRDHNETWGALDHRCGTDHLAAIEAALGEPRPTACAHVREGGCCSGPGYCCHACEPTGEAP